MILEFIGYKTIVAVGLVGSFYFFSGFKNYMDGMDLTRSFSPYYGLRMHDGTRIIAGIWGGILGWFGSIWDSILNYLATQQARMADYFNQQIDPLIRMHPNLSVLIFGIVGFSIAIAGLFGTLYLFKIFYSFLPFTAAATTNRTAVARKEDMWEFDPRRRPSEDILKKMLKTLERSIQKASAMSGTVPKDADNSIRELASRNKDSEYTFRYAVYVMGPIKGTNFTNEFELPLALDQVKKITALMGKTSEYENLPIDLVLLRAKKGQKSWEVEPSSPPIKCGNSYPIKLVESVMVKYRNYFIWDGRAKKPSTGYGTRQ